MRTLGAQHAIVLFNSTRDHQRVDVTLPEGVVSPHFSAIWNKGSYSAVNGKLLHVTIPAREAVILLSEST